MKRSEIVNEARSWLNTPYGHMERVKGAGVDCSQHLIAVAIELGYIGPDFQLPNHAPRPNPRIFRMLTDYLDEVPIEEAKPGDVLVLCFDARRPIPQHIGFMTDAGICHVHPNIERVVEHHIDAVWRDRIVAVYRFRGVED